jgi:hypothetical protein
MRIANTLQCLNAPAKSNIPMLSALTNQPTVKRFSSFAHCQFRARKTFLLIPYCLTKAPTREVLKISRCGPSSGK